MSHSKLDEQNQIVSDLNVRPTNNYMRDLLNIILIASIAVAAHCQCRAEDSVFFPTHPEGVQGPGLTDIYAFWYGESLELMQEPALWPAKPNIQVYRFLILPTWGNPIAVRAVAAGDAYKLISRRLSGQGGYEIGTLAEQLEVTLSDDDSAELRKRINALKFFEMPTEDDTSGTDGEQWLLEGVANGKYHVTHRWCASAYDPDKRGLKPFLHLCEFLVTKSGLSKRPMNRDHELLPLAK